MEMDSGAVYSQKELRRILRPVFSEAGVNKATLFGSYAKGTANDKSDVDIMVDSGLRGLAFFGLLEKVSETLKIPVDLIDVTDIIPGSEIDREIKNTGVMIYAR